MSSLVSAKGPSITVRCCPENLTRLPFLLACKPFASSNTPALTNSSLNFPMEVRSSVLGMIPASESLFALTNTITRIVILPFDLNLKAPHLYVERKTAKSTNAAQDCQEILKRLKTLSLAGDHFPPTRPPRRPTAAVGGMTAGFGRTGKAADEPECSFRN